MPWRSRKFVIARHRLCTSAERMATRRIEVDRFVVQPHKRLHLSKHDPANTLPFEARRDVKGLLEKYTRRLFQLTELLYAQNQWSVLLIFQAMDGAGKDSAVKHVMRGLDPKATQVYSFRSPSTEDLNHDFMWRCMKALPERGRIGIFNRSYYEEVLVVRVRPELLEQQHLPKRRVTPRIWTERYEDIRHIERYLCRNGTIIRKFFLNVSKREQRRRFLERLNDPAKKWKFSANDVNERLRWKEYMRAYEDALSATSTKDAPWYVVPADHKWFTRLAIAQVVIDALERLDLQVPPLTHKDRVQLKEAKRRLRAK
jgi:PPK2 family polyphosphate:nucleotide phosphotransferase